MLLGSDAGLRCGEMIALDLVPLERGLVTVVVDTDVELPTLACGVASPNPEGQLRWRSFRSW